MYLIIIIAIAITNTIITPLLIIRLINPISIAKENMSLLKGKGVKGRQISAPLKVIGVYFSLF